MDQNTAQSDITKTPFGAKPIEKADPQFKKYLSHNATMKKLLERPGYAKGTVKPNLLGVAAAKRLKLKGKKHGFGKPTVAPAQSGPVNTQPVAPMAAPTGIQFKRKG